MRWKEAETTRVAGLGRRYLCVRKQKTDGLIISAAHCDLEIEVQVGY